MVGGLLGHRLGLLDQRLRLVLGGRGEVLLGPRGRDEPTDEGAEAEGDQASGQRVALRLPAHLAGGVRHRDLGVLDRAGGTILDITHGAVVPRVVRVAEDAVLEAGRTLLDLVDLAASHVGRVGAVTERVDVVAEFGAGALDVPTDLLGRVVGGHQFFSSLPVTALGILLTVSAVWGMPLTRLSSPLPLFISTRATMP